jgi:hypothetical protein
MVVGARRQQYMWKTPQIRFGTNIKAISILGFVQTGLEEYVQALLKAFLYIGMGFGGISFVFIIHNRLGMDTQHHR